MAATEYRFPGNKDEHQFWCCIEILERNNNASTLDTLNSIAAKSAESKIGSEKSKMLEANTKKNLEGIIGSSTNIVKDSKNPLSTIWLYMPQNITINDANIYENMDLSTMLNAIASTAETKGVADLFSKDFIDTMGKYTTQAFAQGGGLGGGIAAQSLIASGAVVNPKTQMLYKGPTLRQFALQFKLMPSNANEASTIENLIKTIRENSYPELHGTEKNFFMFPNIFRVKFYYHSGAGATPVEIPMIKFKPCYCENVSTAYNSSQNVFFDDGNPHEIDLTINLKETEVVTREDVQQGY